MRVGICDDEILWQIEAKEMILNYADNHALDIVIECFSTYEDLIEHSNNPFHVVFMDIELEGQLNGIEMAHRINTLWPKCQIIYLTNYLFYATDVYQTDHINFVIKEQFKNRLEQVFDLIHYKIQQSERRFVFSAINGSEIVLLPDEIISFERNERITIISTTKGKYQTKEKISSIIEKIGNIDFVRCHNSCIVYLPATTEMTKEAFVMNDGSEILISRRYLKNVKKAFSKWAFKQVL